MALTHKTNLAKAAQGRIVSQYRNSPLFVGLIGAIVAVIQKVEDACWDLFNALVIDNATGVWLEYLGGIVGEAREGVGDVDYRRFIQARILANRSSGTINEVLVIIALVLNADDATACFLRAEEFYPASMLVEIAEDYGTNLADAALRSRMCRIVARARPVGVRLMINSSDLFSTVCFTLGDSSAVIHALDFTGATGVVDPFGSLIVEGDTSHAFGHILGTGIGGSSGTIWFATLTGDFVDGEPLSCPGSWEATSVGESRESAVFDADRGFGDSSDPTTGGKLISGDLA